MDPSPDISGSLAGRTLGPYRLLRRLGAGGMAEIYRAVAYGASGFEKAIAIKTLRPELRENPRLQRLLIEEARLGARLQHRNLVQVHDLGVAEGIYYVRLDLVEGSDLAVQLQRGRLPVGAALLVAQEVALALAFLHEVTDEAGRPLGLVHRDISPGNILLSTAGEVKLCDLGLAKATMLADVTQANVVKGKYAYMSPEQVSGQALTAQSDQFSLGVTLMELLCGRRPYDGETPLETMERIRAAASPDLSELDEDLAALVRRCLAPAAKDRFSGDEALLEVLSGCARRRPASPADLARLAGADDPRSRGRNPAGRRNREPGADV